MHRIARATLVALLAVTVASTRPATAGTAKPASEPSVVEPLLADRLASAAADDVLTVMIWGDDLRRANAIWSDRERSVLLVEGKG